VKRISGGLVALRRPPVLIGGSRRRPAPVIDKSGLGRAERLAQLADKYYELATPDTTSKRGRENVEAFHVAALAWYAGRSSAARPADKVWLQRFTTANMPPDWIRRGRCLDAFGDHTTNRPTRRTRSPPPGMWAGCCWTARPRRRARAKLVEAARSLLDTTETSGGRCISYSMSVMTRTSYALQRDRGGGALSHECLKRGIWVPGPAGRTATRSRRWRDYLLTKYQPALNGWTYADNNNATLDDPGHLARRDGGYLLPGAQGYHAAPNTLPLPDRYFRPSTCCRQLRRPRIRLSAAGQLCGRLQRRDRPATKVSLGAYAPVEMRVQTLAASTRRVSGASRPAITRNRRPLLLGRGNRSRRRRTASAPRCGTYAAAISMATATASIALSSLRRPRRCPTTG